MPRVFKKVEMGLSLYSTSRLMSSLLSVVSSFSYAWVLLIIAEVISFPAIRSYPERQNPITLTNYLFSLKVRLEAVKISDLLKGISTKFPLLLKKFLGTFWNSR